MRIYMASVMLVASSVSWAQEEIAAPRLLRTDQLQVSVDEVSLQKQYDALRQMTLTTVEYSPRGPVTNIAGDIGIVLPADSSARTKGSPAPDFLPLFADVLLANGTESLTLRDNWTMYGTERGLEFSQSIRGIPVVNGVVSVSYDAGTNRVSSLVAHFVPDRDLPRTPKLSAKQAQEILRKALETELKQGAKAHIREGAYNAYFADFADPSPPALVWVIRALTASDAELFGDEEFYVDSISGLVLSRKSMRHELTRKMYDANNVVLPNVPGTLPTALTPTQINAQSYRSITHSLVQQADQELSVRIPSALPEFPLETHTVVRYGTVFENTGSWADAKGYKKDVLAFAGAGAGYGGSTKHAGLNSDVVAHEFAHGIATRTFPDVGGTNDPRAMHEAYADAAATVVDIGAYGGPDPIRTWIFGDGIYTNSALGLRSFIAPLGDLLVTRWANDWYPDRDLPGNSQHWNLGVFTHAYYLMVNGGYHHRSWEVDIPDILVSALGEQTARDIFFNAFRNSSMNVDPTAKKLKGAAMAYALAAHGSSARTQTKKAFEAVGICETAAVAPPAPTLNSIGNLLCEGRFHPIWEIVTGATRYYAEAAPAAYGWNFAVPVTDVDGSTNNCWLQINQDAIFHIRACNDCGCSDWSSQHYLPYQGECL